MFRTVLIKHSSKLQYLQGYLVIYDGEIETKVFLKEINLLLIESTNTLITIPLMIQLVKNNISVVFCDEKHHPTGTILGLSNHYNNSGNIMSQVNWEENIKNDVWSKIVEAKIKMQLKVLQLFDKSNQHLLEQYLTQIERNDQTNREGLAAKVYFYSLFGHSFNRKEQSAINDLLNYGYAIILSCFNREIVASGYLTQIGIFHKGKTNPFNLSCDFMEPFRPLIDIIAYINVAKEDPILEMRKILSYKVIINKEERFIEDAIRVFVGLIIRMLNGEKITFPNLILKEKGHYYNE